MTTKNRGNFSLQDRPEFTIKKKHKINKVSRKGNKPKPPNMNFVSNPTNETISSIMSNLNQKVDLSPRNREAQGIERKSPLLIEEFENSPLDPRFGSSKNRHKVSPHMVNFYNNFIRMTQF